MSAVAIILVIIIIIVIVYITYKQIHKNQSYAISHFDNKPYAVQNLAQKGEAADMLGDIHHRIFELRDYLYNHMDSYPEYKPYIKQFCNRINNVVLKENTPYGEHTSYTIDKGKVIYLCLRSKKTGELHDTNLVMYVVIHELAHVACPDLHHTKLFKEIFIFLLKISILLGIYQQANYQDFPEEYCGLVIDEYLLKN